MEKPQENGHDHLDTEKAPVGAVPKHEIPMAKLNEIVVSDYMRECLDKVAASEGFSNYEVKIDHGSSIGDGFVGILLKVTILEENSDKLLSLVLKTPPTNHARRHDFGSMYLFQREVLVYNEVLPAFVKFQEEKKISQASGFFNFPKCYYAEFNEENDDAIIIMEDLREKEYKMWSKFVPTNYEHANLLVASLGRLHAISFAMKTQNPELFEKFKVFDDFMATRTDENFSKMMETNLHRTIGALDESDTKKRSKVLKIAENVAEIMKEMTDPKLAEPYAVVTHGDCWTNNFMFQYKRGKPEKIVLLDWQVTRYCSPVIDLVYFFFVCTDKEMRAKHYDELLSTYHKSLKDLLDHLGGDSRQFPFTALLRQLKKFGKYGIILSSFLVSMLNTSSADLPDMDFMAENIKNPDPELMDQMWKMFASKNDAVYRARMRGNVDDAFRYGYL